MQEEIVKRSAGRNQGAKNIENSHNSAKMRWHLALLDARCAGCHNLAAGGMQKKMEKMLQPKGRLLICPPFRRKNATEERNKIVSVKPLTNIWKKLQCGILQFQEALRGAALAVA